MNVMKKIILIIALMLPAMLNFAQEDTTKVKTNEEDVNIEMELDELEKGATKFQAEIKELEKQIESLELESVVDGISEDSKKDIERQIAEAKKQIAAFEKGLSDIEKERKEKELAEHDIDDNDDIDDDDDDDFDFDWDFDKFDHFDKWPFNRKKKKFNGHWAGFELGLTNFLDVNNKLELPTGGEFMEIDPVKSWSYSLNFMEFNIPLHKKYFGIVTGVGFDWKSYTLASDVNLIYDGNDNITFEETEDYTISRNKLNVNSFTFPLLLELQIPMGKKDRRVNITGGVIGSIRVGSNTEQEWDDDNAEYYLKRHSDFNLTTFKYGYTVRVGYRGFQIYANYEVTPLFESGTGPELYPFSVGFRVLNF